ncbi:unnamed protein product, partial [Discosporangium mesarthrocarpum]
IFHPNFSVTYLSTATAQRLLHWAIFWGGQYPYSIQHTAGDLSCWGDLVSRWVTLPKGGGSCRAGALYLPTDVQVDFSMPSLSQVSIAQLTAARSLEGVRCAGTEAYKTPAGDRLHKWCTTIGVPDVWVSDTANHFKNQVLKRMQEVMNLDHCFAVANSPRTNGTG